jgi:hypothetical protein
MCELHDINGKQNIMYVYYVYIALKETLLNKLNN